MTAVVAPCLTAVVDVSQHVEVLAERGLGYATGDGSIDSLVGNAIDDGRPKEHVCRYTVDGHLCCLWDKKMLSRPSIHSRVFPVLRVIHRKNDGL